MVTITININGKPVKVSKRDSDQRLSKTLAKYAIAVLNDPERARCIYRRRRRQAMAECRRNLRLTIVDGDDGVRANRMWRLRLMVANEVLQMLGEF